nr:integrase, catalytic region, zinc finger, CCHC-type, peptidase aspartic, catalytic [Tanacetum cinerariifolium]
YAIGTCSQGSQQRAKQLAHTPLIRKKKVTAIKTSDRLLKTYDGDSSRLLNFVKKFIGTVRLKNDHFGAIMGYGDYVVGESVISRVYYVKGLGHNLFSIGQFCDFDLEVAFRKHSCYVRDTDEAVATTCYTQNLSLIHTRHHKTPYELVHNKKPDLTFFRVFGALCYPTNDSEDLGKLQPTTDTGIFVGYAPSRKVYQIYNKRTRRIMETIHVQFDELTEPMAPVHLSTGPAPNFLTPGQISSGLVPNPVPATPYAPPPIKNWRFYFNQCSKNIWTLLKLTDRVLLLKQYKLQSPQPVHLCLPPLIKMHHLHIFHRHLRPYNLTVYLQELRLNLISWKTIHCSRCQ